MSAGFSAILRITCLLLMVSGSPAWSQNAPVTTATTVGNLSPGDVNIPITVTGFNNIGAISLSIDYDYSVMHFTGATPHPQLPGFPAGDLDLGTGFHRVSMGWFGFGKTLPDGSTIITLHFDYLGGNGELTWYDSGPSCEYADGNYIVLNDLPTSEYYHNGHVCGAMGAIGPVTGNNALCQGASGEIYSIVPIANATGYNWTVPEGAEIINGQNTSTIAVNFSDTAVSGNVSVYGYNNCGNGPASTLAVTVNPLPVAAAGNDTTINYGTSTTLHAAPGGSGSYTYHWAPENLLVNPYVMNPQTVILTSTSIFTLTVTDVETSCQSTDQVTVTITGGPLSVAPVVAPPAICTGEPAQLFANAGGGSGLYTYLWTCDPPGSPPWTSTLANPVVSPDSSRHYFLSVSDGFTLVFGSAVLTVYELPSAFISGGDTLCGVNAFTTLQVDLTGVPPWSFTYAFGNTSVFVGNLGSTPYFINAFDPGDYIITNVEDAHCSGTGSGVAIVRKYPVPATPEITVNGYELISSACCGNQWFKEGVAIPGATGSSYFVTESGQYHVVVTLNGCSSAPSEPVDLIVGIRELTGPAFSVYPNPATSSISVKAMEKISKDLNISIHSISGALISSQIMSASEGVLSIDVSTLPEGVYILSINGTEFTAKKRFIII